MAATTNHRTSSHHAMGMPRRRNEDCTTADTGTIPTIATQYGHRMETSDLAMDIARRRAS